MATEHRIDRGDFIEVWEGEPTWDDPSVWSSYRVEWKPGTEPYITENNETTLTERAHTALLVNADFLAINNPTNAQAVAQMKVLTRQVNGIIRLQLRALEDIADA